MSVLDQLRESLSDFSRNERHVADYILNNPQEMRSLSGEALAAICGVSRSTVLRLCQNVTNGLHVNEKIVDRAIREYLPFLATENIMMEAVKRGGDRQELHEKIRQHSMAATARMKEGESCDLLDPLVTSDALRDFADTLSHANRVVALGLNHSSVSAEQLAFRLNKFGVDCHMLWDDARMASYERVLKQGDVVVIFSISGRDFYETLVSEYRKNRVKVVLITMDPDSSLCHLVDISIVLPFLTYNAGGMYPMDETVIFFMFIEMLAEKLHQTLHRLDE